jgi:hypothetical protein
MGGRKSYSYTAVLGGGSGVKQGLNEVQTKITSGDYNDAVKAAVKVIAISDPGTRSIIFTLKLAKVGFEIYSSADAEYQRTGDYESALTKAIFDVVGNELAGSGEPLVNAAVKVCWDGVKSAAGIEESHTEIDELVVNSITNVLMTKAMGSDVDVQSFLADSCSNAVGMLFETEIKSKEHEGAFLSRSYEEQKLIERMLKNASGEVAKALVNRLIDEGFPAKTIPDKVLKSILEQALNDTIDKVTSS